MHPPKTQQLYWQQIKPLSQCNAKDGKAVGHLLMDLIESNPKHLAHEVRAFASRVTMLRNCGLRHIGSMLWAATELATRNGQDASIASEESPATSGLVASPDELTDEDAASIGQLLSLRLRSSHAPATALGNVVRSVNALHAMAVRYEWFVPMLQAVAERRVSAAQQLSTAGRLLSRRRLLSQRASSAVAPDGLDLRSTEDDENNFDSVAPSPVCS